PHHRVARVDLSADQLVGGEDRGDAFHERMVLDAELADDALVADRAEDGALGAWHVEGLQPERGDPADDLLGVLLGCLWLEHDDHACFSFSTSDHNYGDISPVPRTAPRTPG